MWRTLAAIAHPRKPRLRSAQPQRANATLWRCSVSPRAWLHLDQAFPAGSITDAHHAALRLRREDVLHNGKIDRNFQFLLPAGPGAFICSATAGADVSPRSVPGMHVRAHTWLSDDMLRDDQTPLIGDGAPGERLGDDRCSRASIPA